MGWESSFGWGIAYLPEERTDWSEPISEGMIEMWAPPRLTFTKPFTARANSDLLNEFSRRFTSVCRYYPEIRGEIKVGMTNSYKGLAMTESDGSTMVKKISFPPLSRSGMPSRYVIGHELMHIVQAKQKFIPGTERATDVYTLARLPPRYIDHPPIYLSTPKSIRRTWSDEDIHPIVSEIAHDLAIEAVMSRKSNTRYIRWWESLFREMTDNNNRLNRIISRKLN